MADEAAEVGAMAVTVHDAGAGWVGVPTPRAAPGGSRASSPGRRLAGLVAVVALAGFLVGGQVALSASRPAARTDAIRTVDAAAPVAGDGAALRQAEADGIDVERVIDGVRHHIAPDAARPGTLVVEDEVYRASFDSRGFQVGEPGAEPWFALSLTSVSRGGRALAPDVGPWAGEANAASRPVAVGASERVTARQGELEWDVVLSSPPPGSGMVRVEAAATGGRPELVGDGWRWRRDDGCGHVDMGELVVLDATGAELYRARPGVVDDRVRLDVPEKVLEGAAYPVTIDPELGPEHPVAPAIIHRPDQATPVSVASDGTNYLAVFAADRLYAVRMDRSGRLLDRTPIVISPLYQFSWADVAFDGANYLVVWQTDGVPSDIWGTRLNPEGDVLDEGGFPINVDPEHDSAPFVAFDGTNFLITWSRGCCFTATDVMTTRVDRQGQLVDPVATRIPGPVGDSDYAIGVTGLAFGITDHLAVWQQQNGLWAARLAPDGSLVDPGFTQLSAAVDVQGSTVAFDGENWQVFWSQRAGAGGSTDVLAVRVSPSGTVLDPAPLPIATTTSNETYPSATRSGDDVVVAWTDDRGAGDAYAARVDRSGAVLAPGPIAVATGPGEQRAGPLAAGDDQVLATVGGTEGGTCCFAQAVRLTEAGRVLDPEPLLLSYQSNSQFDPKVAFDGTNYLVAWNDDRDDEFYRSHIYVARVTPSGVSLDPAGIRVGFVTGEFLTDVAFDGENFIVAMTRPIWQDGSYDYDIVMSRVSRGGELLTPSSVPVAEGPEADLGAHLSPDGTNTVVFWSRAGGGIMAARISRTGAVLDPGGIGVSPGDTGVAYPSAAFDGTNHLLVYPRGADEPYGSGDAIVARRVTPSLAVLDAEARPITSSPGSYRNPDVSWGGRNHLVVWSSYVIDLGEEWVEGARLGPDGSVLEPGVFRLSTTEDGQSEPTVASLDGWFLVTWTRQRGTSWPGDQDVLGARIHESGANLDPEGFVIAENAVRSDVVAGPNGRWAFTYRTLPGPTTSAERVLLRTVSPK